MEAQVKMTLSAKEAAALLGLSMPVMYKLTNRADFPAVKVGGRTLISRKGLDDWLERVTMKKEA